jgi:hypothetical protein
LSILLTAILKEVYFNVATLIKCRYLPAKRWKTNYGYCPICEARTLFVAKTQWLRDFYFCLRCHSIPRQRALIQVLQTAIPHWRELIIHESSPDGPSSDKLKSECKQYLATHLYKDVPLGTAKKEVRCENLERQTFADAQFDLVITQDVFEHVLNPGTVFREIARTLKPGGAHVFTVPWYRWKATLVRAQELDGIIKHIEPPDYHGNPIDPDGSLVVTEWGADFCDYIFEQSKMHTDVVALHDRYRGLEAEFIEVFVSRKGQ